MGRFKLVAAVALVLIATLRSVPAQPKKEPLPTEPQALYIFPAGGQRGSTVAIQIDGQTLGDTYAVWTDCQQLHASVKKVVEIDREVWIAPYVPQKRLTHEVTLEVKISQAAALGGHTLRLVSPRGISNPVPFRVSSEHEPLILEDESQTGSDKPIRGQAVEYPVAINGRLGRILGGEVDYYSFDAEAGRSIDFDVFFPSLGGKMLLYLYQPSASWVDPHRLVQLAFNDDPIAYERGLFGSPPDLIIRSRLRHRFAESGRYLIAVKSYDDRGGPGFVYQLRISPAREEVASFHRAWPLAHPAAYKWLERRFDRHLSDIRLEQVSRRTVLVPPEEPAMEGKTGSSSADGSSEDVTARQPAVAFDPEQPVSTYRAERNAEGRQEHVPNLDLPAFLEGVIDQPGKTDHYRFKVKSGQALAFEVATPRQIVPVFNPWVRILDEQQEVVFSCIYNLVEGNNVQLFRYFEPKMVYTFAQDGEYTLEIRDLTTRYWGDDFVYRVMIRPQIPHVGGLEMDVDRANLVPGEAKRLTVTADREEGFEGEIALSLENLPAGVRAYPTAAPEEPRPPAFDEGQKDIFRPVTQKVAISLIADETASTIRVPQVVRVNARPIVNGKPGMLIPVGEVLVMVVPPVTSETPETSGRASTPQR